MLSRLLRFYASSKGTPKLVDMCDRSMRRSSTHTFYIVMTRVTGISSRTDHPRRMLMVAVATERSLWATSENEEVI